jgi:hypothetical protein
VVVRNQPTSVWVWLVPAVLLFLAAMITLWVTNYRADIREWNKWRRDTLIKLCSDALAAAREAEDMCESALSQQTAAVAQVDLTSASQAAARIGTIADQLSLMGVVNYLADTCTSMRASADAIISRASQFRSAHITALIQEQTGSSPGVIHSVALAEHVKETQYKEARDQLEALRKSFIERGLIEIRSTSK